MNRKRLLLAGLLPTTLLMALVPPVSAVPESGEGVYLVRFADRITDASLGSLAATGVSVVDYEPEDSYLVWADAAQARVVQRVTAVRSVEPMPTGRKLSPALGAPLGGDGPLVLADVTVYAPGLEETVAGLASLGEVIGVGLAGSDGERTTLTVRLPRPALLPATGLPGVLYVAPAARGLAPLDESSNQVVAGNIDVGSNRPVTGYAAWLAELGLDGEGVKVAVVDTGVQAAHPDLSGRVEKPHNYHDPVVGMVDQFGHGTHVAGIIGGAPPLGILPADPEGFVYGLGVAPAVRMVDLNATMAPGFAGPNLDLLARDAWRAGTRMWNASWHTQEGWRAGYTATTRMVDVLARDADLDAPGAQEFLFVFAAANAGQQGPGVPMEAKNIISVGSTASDRGLAWPLTDDIDRVSDWSSRGPTADGRWFPVLSAPGENVVSARSPEGALVLGCALGAVQPVDGATLYMTCSGTSMAAPHVTGAAALVHQWWQRETGTLPSPALVRALLVNAAADIGAQPVPNNDEGWGRLHLGDVFAAVPDVWEDQGVVLTDPGDDAAWLVEVDGTGPLRVTLAWSDAPAAVGADPTLVNDLDLVVELLDAQGAAQTTWLGNVFAGGSSVAGGAPDRLHTLENVFLDEADAGTYRITVRAHNVPGDGIPHNDTPTDQDFALIVRTP